MDPASEARKFREAELSKERQPWFMMLGASLSSKPIREELSTRMKRGDCPFEDIASFFNALVAGKEDFAWKCAKKFGIVPRETRTIAQCLIDTLNDMIIRRGMRKACSELGVSSTLEPEEFAKRLETLAAGLRSRLPEPETESTDEPEKSNGKADGSGQGDVSPIQPQVS